MTKENKYLGKIRNITDKGYGFIRDQKSQSIFFHATGLVGVQILDLTPGTLVEFEKLDTDKGVQAVNIIIIEDVE
jgi:CspA family cold shock protein